MKKLFIRLLWHYSLISPRKGMKIAGTMLAKFMFMIFYRHKVTAPLPITFILRITNRCNLRCIQCGQWGARGVHQTNKDNALHEELSMEEWLLFIEQNKKMIPYISFFGGEPFLRNDVLQVAKYASERGIPLEIATNGLFLQEKAEDIVESHIDYISVSIDGPEDINNSIRRGVGNRYQIIVSGVEKLLSIRRKKKSIVPVVEICFTVTSQNYKYALETYGIAKQLGVDVFRLQLGIFTTEPLERISSQMYQDVFGIRPSYWKGFIRDVSEINPAVIKEQLKAIQEDVSRNKKILFRQIPSCSFDIHDYFFAPGKSLLNDRCTVPWKYLQVLPNGDIVLCMDFADLIGGNIRVDDWRNAWNGEKFKKFRNHILENGTFPSCSRCCTYFSSISESKAKRFAKSLF